MSKKITRFTQRVDYAERGIMISEDSRTLDACFEMHDGAFVVTALMRRAEESPELSRQIAQMFSIAAPSGVTPWHKTAAKYAAIPTDRLHIAAKQERARAKEAFDAYMARPKGCPIPKQLDLI